MKWKIQCIKLYLKRSHYKVQSELSWSWHWQLHIKIFGRPIAATADILIRIKHIGPRKDRIKEMPIIYSKKIKNKYSKDWIVWKKKAISIGWNTIMRLRLIQRVELNTLILISNLFHWSSFIFKYWNFPNLYITVYLSCYTVLFNGEILWLLLSKISKYLYSWAKIFFLYIWDGKNYGNQRFKLNHQIVELMKIHKIYFWYEWIRNRTQICWSILHNSLNVKFQSKLKNFSKMSKKI